MNICVYGASSNTIDKKFIDETEKLGALMAKRGHGLVYGGGAHGLMGAAARGVAENNGKILGVAPRFFLADGALYDNCTEFIYTDTMRERKQIMEDRSDAFIVTPGGVGTYEEFFEILTLKQLGRHKKPIAIYNLCGYYNVMNDMLEQTIEKSFMRDTCRELYKFFENAEEMLNYIENYNATEGSISYFKNV